MTDPSELRAAAVRLGHARGWTFCRLDGKAPVDKGWQSAERESLETALAWAAEGNIGLRTGHQSSGIVVLDIDEEADGDDLADLELPETVTVQSGGNGFHLYFASDRPLTNSRGQLPDGVDFRGQGGQAAFVGCIHPDTGRPYLWMPELSPEDIDVAPLPDALAELLTPKPKPTRPSQPSSVIATIGHGHPYARKALHDEAHKVANAPPGQRNNVLNAAAHKLGGFVASEALTQKEVASALQEASDSIPDRGDTSGEVRATIASGLESGMKEPRTIPEGNAVPKTPPVQAQPTALPDPEVILTPGPHVTDQGEYHEATNQTFADEVLRRLAPGSLYRKGDLLGTLSGLPGSQTFYVLTEHQMRVLIDSQLRLGKWTKKGDRETLVYQPTNKDHASIVLARASRSTDIRQIDLQTSYPVYRSDWTRSPAGWEDGILYDPPPSLHDIEPITEPTTIRDTLEDLLVDFPFATTADLHNYIGLLLTPLIQPAVGNRPMHLIGASLERTGKSKLAQDVLGGVLLGAGVPTLQLGKNDEENDKRILSTLIQGQTITNLDNLHDHLDSAAFASLLTSSTYSGRLLGASQIVSLPNNLTLVATGNNVRTTGEIAKRMVPITLQPATDHPEHRTNFVHPDLNGFIAENRHTILGCLLGAIDNWIAAGRPKHPFRMGGFEDWAQTVGGILSHAGFTDWMVGWDDWVRGMNPSAGDLEQLVEMWHMGHGNSPVTASTLMDIAGQHELFPEVFAAKTPHGAKIAFSRKVLQKNVDRPVGDHIIRRQGSGNNAAYALAPLS